MTGGWFVVNARGAPWLHNDLRSACRFGGEGEAPHARFSEPRPGPAPEGL